MVLGFLLAVLAIKLDFNVPRDRQAITSMVPIVVLGLPIFDTTLVVFTRLREGRSPMQGGKDHTSHRLASTGLGQRGAVLAIYAICVVLGFVAITLSHASISDGWIIGSVLAVIAVISFGALEVVYARNKH